MHFDGLIDAAYTPCGASDEGIRGKRSAKRHGGNAVSGTTVDRETAFFYAVRPAVRADLLLRGGHVVDPLGGVDGAADVRVRRGVVDAVGNLQPEPTDRVVNVAGLIVAPGLIDVHVHLREPGHEWKETLASGSAAAAAGGFTTVYCMPNTDPAIDSVAALEGLKRRVNRDAVVRVYAIAAISEGRRGRRAVDFDALAGAGVVGFSDDGTTTADSRVMRSALEASQRNGLPVIVHCEDATLAGGAMHEGGVSRKLGIKGIPAAAEEIVIARDLRLAELTGGWLHVCHVSTGRGLELVAAARRGGARVTAEVMPHHLTMTDEWVAGCRELVNVDEPPGSAGQPAGGNSKVNPPLRPRTDACELLGALKRGEVDVIATDHAPHALPEKQGCSFDEAAFGLTGSEVALPLMLALVRAKEMSLSDVVRLMSVNPARLWNLDGGTLRPGSRADIVVFDPDERWQLTADRFVSRGANSPLLEMELRGRVKQTYVAGEERYRDW